MANLNRLSYKVENNLKEIEPLYAGGMAMVVYMPYVVIFMDFVEKTVEPIFLYLEEFDFRVQGAAFMDWLQTGMRQMYELMTVEHLWTCWLLAVTMLLIGSHVGLWRRIQTTSWSRAKWSSTRMETQKLRVKKSSA